MTNLQPDRTSQSSKATASKQSSFERSSSARSDHPTKLSRSIGSYLDAQAEVTGASKGKPHKRLQNMIDTRPQKSTRSTHEADDDAKSDLSARSVSGHVRAGEQQLKKVNILGMDFDNFSMQELLHKLQKGIIFTPNVDHMMKLRNDPEFAQVYQKADFKICDSQIVMYASKFLGKTLKEKLSGSDLFPLFCEHHKHNENIKIFLLGGKEGVAKEARARINQRIGREIVVGEYSPPFGFENSAEECDRILERIQASDATVIAVCLGAPKQEKWIATYSEHLPNIDIFMAVGAVVDFEAGTKPRAPKYVSDLGLEWLYRLVCEPRRLWKRYLLEDMPFVGLVLAEKFKQITATGR